MLLGEIFPISTRYFPSNFQSINYNLIFVIRYQVSMWVLHVPFVLNSPPHLFLIHNPCLLKPFNSQSSHLCLQSCSLYPTSPADLLLADLLLYALQIEHKARIHSNGEHSVLIFSACIISLNTRFCNSIHLFM